MKTTVPSVNAMSFFHSKGLVPAWKQAQKFIGDAGRVATMLDIVDARLATGIDEKPWNTYYTTASAEYFGYSRGGVRILIVAHGVGPMANIDGMLKAYSYEYKDKSRNKRGGRISDAEFRKLEDGFYGDVTIVEFDPIVERYEYPFIGNLSVSQALAEPLLQARFGPRANDYIWHHAKMACGWHAEQVVKDPENRHGTPPETWGKYLLRRRADHDKLSDINADTLIIGMEDPGNCSYTSGGFGHHPRVYHQLDKGHGAVAHLLSTSRLQWTSLSGEDQMEALLCDIKGHEWGDGVRLVGIRGDDSIEDIHPGADGAHNLVRNYWQDLLVTNETPDNTPRSYVLMQTGEDWFTQYKKTGDVMDTGSREFHVRSVEPVGEPVEFVTEILGYYGFFKYHVGDVETLMPPEANAYMFVSDVENIWEDGNPERQRCMVQFYRADVDTSARIMTSDELENDFDLIMSLLEKKAA